MSIYPKFLSIGCLVLTAGNYACTNVTETERTENSRPNIVLVFVDDAGYGDVGVFGATDFETPHLDEMAANGMKFNDFLVSSAVCSASRAGLLSGCYSNRIGISGAIMPYDNIGFHPEEETMPELLKKAGYKTIAIGKWHLGHQPEFLPVSHGFDEFYGIPYSNDMWPFTYDNIRATPETHARKASYPELPLMHNFEKVGEFLSIEDQDQMTTMFTEKAVEFIKENKNDPFFLYLAHPMPHVPLAVSEKFRGKSRQGLYGDVMMELDWSVGEVVKALEEYGLTENTLVIFTSDNGPWLNFGDHGGSAGGLREGKGTTWEGGQRVPCIMKWPAVIPPGTVCSKMASAIDLLPTFSAIAGAPLPERRIDGVNILPLLKGEKGANPREIFYYYFRENNLQAVRWNNWKLVFPHPGRSYEGFEPGRDGLSGELDNNFPFESGLYDLRRDPGERYNVMEYFPDIMNKLELIAEEAREDLGDFLTDRPGKNRREPGILQ